MSLADEIAADNPVGYWRRVTATAAAGSPGAADASGNGLYLTAYNGGGAAAGYPQDGASLIVTDDTDPSMEFVAESNLWNPPRYAELDFAGDFSVVVWCEPALVDANFRDLVRKGNFYGLQIGEGGTFEGFVTLAGSVFHLLTGAVPVVEDTAYHVALTYATATGLLSLYVNGVLDVAATYGVNAVEVSNGQSFTVGQSNSATNAFVGRVDEVAVYDSKLSAARVLAHYEAGAEGPGAGGSGLMVREGGAWVSRSRVSRVGGEWV